jgi:hypothetical protein
MERHESLQTALFYVFRMGRLYAFSRVGVKMEKCSAPGCRGIATSEYEGMGLCEEHYYEYATKYKSEWESLLEDDLT